MSVAQQERALLVGTMREVGPEQPTLCGDWTTRAVTTGRPMDTFKAADLLDRIRIDHAVATPGHPVAGLYPYRWADQRQRRI